MELYANLILLIYLTVGSIQKYFRLRSNNKSSYIDTSLISFLNAFLSVLRFRDYLIVVVKVEYGIFYISN